MKSKHTHKYIFICGSKSCRKRGSNKLIAELKDFIKSKGLKREIKLVKTKCMDYCKSGPNLINNDQLYHEVNPEEAKGILKGLMKDAN
jgi:NADH-quinone oxidoreductase subunit F